MQVHFLLVSDEGDNIAVISKQNKSVSEFNKAIETAINEEYIYDNSKIDRFEDNMVFDCTSVNEDGDEEVRQFVLRAIAVY